MRQTAQRSHPDGSLERWLVPENVYQLEQDGVITITRPFTDAELAVNTIDELERLRRTSRHTVLQQARTAYENNKTFLALPAPTFPLGITAQQVLVDQVTALTRQVNGIIRLIVQSDLLEE